MNEDAARIPISPAQCEMYDWLVELGLSVLSERQIKALLFLIHGDYIEDRGFPVRERAKLAHALGIAPKSTYEILRGLHQLGLLRRIGERLDASYSVTKRYQPPAPEVD
jgi:hypothetical protein